MDLRLQGRRALITGGSRGIGLGTANVLAREGCHLALAARSPASLEQARSTLLGRYPDVRVDSYPFDLSLAENAPALAQACGPVDILINNAGAIPQATLDAMPEDQWHKAWDLKLFGFINLTREIFRDMKSRGGGVIVNVIGIAGERPLPHYLAGSMGNAALMAMTRALGVEGIGHGVRVVGVNPGATETDRQMDRWKAKAQVQFGDETRWRELTRDYPLGRLATVDEIANSIVFLCSDLSSYTNATIVTIDGGWTAAK